MDLELEVTALTVLSTAMFLGGILLVLLYGQALMLTIVGIVLIVLSTIVFLVDLMDVVSHWSRLTGE